MKQYVIDNTQSSYFGITGFELERWNDERDNITWVKLVFDYCNSFNKIEEVSVWFKSNELVEV